MRQLFGRLDFSFSVCVVFLCLSLYGSVSGSYVKYNTGGGIVEGKLNVHLVPHSHDDVGWLKTIDQYYVGSNNSIQGACVENVLDSVVESLLRDPNRKFVFAEMAFFTRWWVEQSVETQETVRKLVDSGQLEFINGGWCMHDEATCHYIDMIDQTTLGHRFIKEQFNYIPRAGWQIDPFGHSAVQAYLLGAELGFDSVHFARIDYQDRAKRKNEKSLEVIWRGSKTFGSSSQIFTNAFPVHYSPPSGFHFEVNGDYVPIQLQDNLLLYDYNVEKRVNDFINNATFQANVTRTNHIMWTMGDDFQYQYAESWFKQMDKFIHYVNKCQLLNISYCPPTEEDTPEGKSLVVVAYNPLGWNRTDIIKIPVNDANLVVQDSSGNTIEAQYVALDNVTANLRIFYTKAYLGQSSKQIPKYWLLFQASVPPLGWNTYFISNASGKGIWEIRNGFLSTMDTTQNGTIEIGPGNLKMSFSSTSGQLKRIYNTKTGVDVPTQQSYLWYASSPGDAVPQVCNIYAGLEVIMTGFSDTIVILSLLQASGAYIFRPSGPPNIQFDMLQVPLKVIRGPLVDEVLQQFNSWIYQVTRLYRDKEHAEVEFTIGPIPVDDSVGKEVIMRMTTNMVTNKVFYTDSNGRDFLERIRDYRADWPLSVNQPVAGNYYPLNLGIYTRDNKSELSVLVDRATGGASIEDGEIELMLHRRTIYDDSRGVGEALDESVCVDESCEGLTVRGNYYVSINQLGAGARWRRTTGQEVYSPLLLAFTHEKLEDWKASHLTKATAIDPNYSLPLNVALITLQELDDGSVLLRLAHLYEVGEDAEYSTLANVDLKKIFTGKTIKEVKEMSLSTNQEKSEMKRMTWRVEGDSRKEPNPIRGGPINNSTLVELGPMEIRTFLLKF
ncbi:hypothetical protein SO802_025135 [Lithocarpus litseifolius]|uniref:alpha-mannosidase n=1 Tax=Lithocarpus litseifolius TaxID=425828 RepID=A0AAW2C1D7_9ROSI